MIDFRTKHVVLLGLCIAAAALVRFVGVAQSPPGFYIDEAAISAQVICVRESGANLQGRARPLFTPVLGGGYLTPSYLYPALAWTAVFGDGIASFRTLAAFYSLLFIVGSFVFGARFWASTQAGWLCALSAAVSPWAFQFARIAWDPSLAPAYAVWAFALLWGRKRWEFAFSGILFSLAAYCYPPLRVQLAILMPLAIVGLSLERKDWRPYLLTVAVAALVSLPLVKLTLSGDIQGRFEMLSVFNADYLRQTYGSSSLLNGLRALVANVTLLLNPRYLLLAGDANLRHSTGSFGIWSWLDALGASVAVSALAQTLLTKLRTKISAGQSVSASEKQNEFTKRSAPLVSFKASFVLIGYLTGLLGAALTWESNPHALRSFGAVTFLVLGVGGALSTLWNRPSAIATRAMRALVLIVACVSFALFARVYFFEYPARARAWFDTDITELAKQLSGEHRLLDMPEVLKARGISYDPMAISYYQLADGAIRCPVGASLETPPGAAREAPPPEAR